MANRNQEVKRLVSNDEHIIRCSVCGRDLIVKDNVNDVMAFLSHLKNDHSITYTPQRMTEMRTERIKQKSIHERDMNY
jgi:tRNA U54 and U55 pseudouridine synthase Pus10